MNISHKQAALERKVTSDSIIYLDISNKNGIKSFDESDISLHPIKFLLIIKIVGDVPAQTLHTLQHVLTEGMNLTELIDLLERLGVEKSVTEAVRAEIENEGAFTIVPLGHEQNVDHAGTMPSPQVNDGNERPAGAHAARIMAERKAPTRSEPEPVHRPASWNDAVAQVPALRKWVEVKREGLATGRELRDILIGHLRDKEHGIGMWVASGTDFPVGALRHFDQTLRHDIGNPAQWDFPEDIRVIAGTRGRPVGSLDSEPRGRRAAQPTAQEVRDAWRIARRAQRGGISN